MAGPAEPTMPLVSRSHARVGYMTSRTGSVEATGRYKKPMFKSAGAPFSCRDRWSATSEHQGGWCPLEGPGIAASTPT
jgi:hypothetical protein